MAPFVILWVPVFLGLCLVGVVAGVGSGLLLWNDGLVHVDLGVCLLFLWILS